MDEPSVTNPHAAQQELLGLVQSLLTPASQQMDALGVRHVIVTLCPDRQCFLITSSTPDGKEKAVMLEQLSHLLAKAANEQRGRASGLILPQ